MFSGCSVLATLHFNSLLVGVGVWRGAAAREAAAEKGCDIYIEAILFYLCVYFI